MPPSREPELSAHESTLIGVLCDEYEASLKSGGSSHLEQLVRDPRMNGQPPHVSRALFRELLKLDIWYRAARGDHLTCDMYCDRFDEHRDDIHQLRLLFPVRQVIAGFRTLRLFGTGGMSETYLTRREPDGTIAVLKLLQSSSHAGRDSVDRFRREVRCAELDHPNVVKVLDTGKADGRPYLLMEFIVGESLDEIVKHEGPLNVANACALVRQAALGVAHAHEHGIIHRDLTPKNLLLDRNGQVKVIDFGLAKWLAEEAVDDNTASGMCIGTLGFMAPEQVTGQGIIDARTDVFGLGATLYYLLTGERPVPGSNRGELLAAHADDKIRPIHEILPDIPPALADAIARMLAFDPSQRLASAQAVAEALSLFCAGSELKSLLSEEYQATLDSVLEEMEQEPAVPATTTVESDRGSRHWLRSGWTGLLALTLLVLVAVWIGSGLNRQPVDQELGSVEPASDSSATRATLDPEPVFRIPDVPNLLETGWLYKPRRPMGDTRTVEWSPDGTRIALGTETGEVRICGGGDLADYRTVSQHRGRVEWVRWNRTATLLASASHNGMIHVVTVDGQIVATIDTGIGLADIAWNPQGDKIASLGDKPARAAVWDLQGKEQANFVADQYYGSRILWNADGRRLATCGGESRVRFWLPDGTPDGEIGPTPCATCFLGWTPQGVILALFTTEKTVVAWNQPEQRWIPLEVGEEPTSMTLSADGQWLACGRRDEQIVAGRFSVPPGGEAQVTEPNLIPFAGKECSAWHPTEPKIVMCGDTITAWQLQPNGEAKKLAESATYAARGIRRVQWQPGGNQFAVCGDEGLFEIREATGEQLAAPVVDADVGVLAWSPDGKSLATGSDNGVVRYWSPDGTLVSTGSRHPKPVRHLAWKPDSQWLASSDGAQSIRLDSVVPVLTNGPAIATGAAVESLCWSSDGEFLIDGLAGLSGIQAWSEGSQFRVFSRIVSRSLRDHAAMLAPHPSRPLLAAGASYGTLILCNLDDGEIKPLSSEASEGLQIHHSAVRTGAWSHDGQRLATTDDQGLVAFWTPRGTHVGNLRTRTRIDVLRWSPDDRWLAAGDTSCTLWVWSIADGQGFQLANNLGAVTTFDWSPDSRKLVLGTKGGALRLVDVGSRVIAKTILFGKAGRTAELDEAGVFQAGDRGFWDEEFAR